MRSEQYESVIGYIRDNLDLIKESLENNAISKHKESVLKALASNPRS